MRTRSQRKKYAQTRAAQAAQRVARQAERARDVKPFDRLAYQWLLEDERLRDEGFDPNEPPEPFAGRLPGDRAPRGLRW